MDPPVRVVWDPSLETTPAYYWHEPEGVDEIALNPSWWAEHSRPERRAVVGHEVGHNLTLAVYRPGVNRSDRRRLEARADRAGLSWLIPDAAVLAALADCEALWEFAERWGVDEATAAARLRLWGWTR